ncbi:epidermal growth factor receptor kinase substrate 8-like isoform X2 [Megalops cyprinoides]|uniref:epidermal growth factor receptor kinase substrate 8-like isoform X2 n=1 Tax=Megalops cyprinoides TaxID=118141 RepID=UPI00186529CD|nr:epidermal growth factor receptor kinase substrate 8-like isoform X2 [Megalops cyprinoides]
MTDTSRYHVEHLTSFVMSRKEGVISVADGIRKLRLHDAKGKVWTQDILLQVDTRAVSLYDPETKGRLEDFPVSTILQSQAILRACSYDSILALVCKEPGQAKPHLHLFQCDEVKANLIQADIESTISDRKSGRTKKRPDVLRMISKSDRVSPSPPPEGPPPDLPTQPEASRGLAAWAVNEQQTNGMQCSLWDETPERTAARVDRDVQILNHLLDDIEYFLTKLQKAAEALNELFKRTGLSCKKKGPGDGVLTLRAKLPPQAEFIDCFQKFKHAFNLLGKLRYHIWNPSASDLVHFLFTPLNMVVQASGGVTLAQTVLSPLLTRDAIDFLHSAATSAEKCLWVSLGDSWTKCRLEWPKDYPFPPYTPRFRRGWEPPVLAFEGPWREREVTQLARSLAGVELQHTEEQHSARGFGGANGNYEIHSRTQPRKYARSKEDFMAGKNTELTVVKGELVEVLDDRKQWWKVRNSTGDFGYVPSNFLQITQVMDITGGRGQPVNTHTYQIMMPKKEFELLKQLLDEKNERPGHVLQSIKTTVPPTLAPSSPSLTQLYTPPPSHIATPPPGKKQTATSIGFQLNSNTSGGSQQNSTTFTDSVCDTANQQQGEEPGLLSCRKSSMEEAPPCFIDRKSNMKEAPPCVTDRKFSVEEAPPCFTGRKFSVEEAPPCVTDRKFSVEEAPPCVTDRKSSMEEAPPCVIDRKSSMEEAPPCLIDRKSSVEEVPPCFTGKKSSMEEAPPCVTDRKFSVEEAPPCVTDRKSNMKEAPPCVIDRESSTEKAPPCVIDRKSSVEEAPPCFTGRKSSMEEAPPCVTDRESNMEEAPPCVTDRKFSVEEAPPCVTDRKSSVEEAPPCVTDRKFSVEEAPPCVIDSKSSVRQAPPCVTNRKYSVEAPPCVTDRKSSVEEAPPCVTDRKFSVEEANPCVIDSKSSVRQAPPCVTNRKYSVEEAPPCVTDRKSSVEEAPPCVTGRKSSREEVQDKLQQPLTLGCSAQKKLQIPQQSADLPALGITYNSSPKMVKAWLQAKGFSSVTAESLGVLTGAQLFSLSKEELKTVCPEEGARVYSQVTVQRANLEKSSGSELQQVMRRWQEKLSAAASDSGVKYFDEAH